MLRFALFGFKGRLNRLSWLGWELVSLAIGLVLGASGAVVLAAGSRLRQANTELGAIVFALAAVWLIWSAVALGVKRLHDMNLSGHHLWWIYGIALLPGPFALLAWEAGFACGLLSLAVGLWMACRRGSEGSNRFGISPVRRREARARLAARQRERQRRDPPSIRRDALL